MEYLSRVFLDKHTKKYLKRLSIKTQFKIELLLPFTGCKKVLGKSVGKSEGKGGRKDMFFTFWRGKGSCITIFWYLWSQHKRNALDTFTKNRRSLVLRNVCPDDLRKSVKTTSIIIAICLFESLQNSLW